MIHRVERTAVSEERREVLRPLAEDLLALGLTQHDAELRGEAEHDLLLELEQLRKGTGHLAHGSHHPRSGDDGRGQLHGSPRRRDRRGPLHQALRA